MPLEIKGKPVSEDALLSPEEYQRKVQRLQRYKDEIRKTERKKTIINSILGLFVVLGWLLVLGGIIAWLAGYLGGRNAVISIGAGVVFLIIAAIVNAIIEKFLDPPSYPGFSSGSPSGRSSSSPLG